MEFLVVFWLLCGVGSALIATSKNRNGCAWLLIGFALGPIALLTVGFMSAANPADTMPCPQCAEAIKRQATVCRYCGHPIDRQKVKQDQIRRENAEEELNKKIALAIIAIPIVFVVGMLVVYSAGR